jgi:hypothetical protein
MAGADEGGLGWTVDDIGRFTSGPLKGQNKQSLFGTNNLAAQLRNRLQKLRGYDYTSDIKTKKEKEIISALNQIKNQENKGYSGTPGGNTGSGAFAKIDNSGKTYGPYSGNQGSNQSSNQSSKGGGYSRGNYGGRGHHWARGGIINLIKR